MFCWFYHVWLFFTASDGTAQPHRTLAVFQVAETATKIFSSLVEPDIGSALKSTRNFPHLQGEAVQFLSDFHAPMVAWTIHSLSCVWFKMVDFSGDQVRCAVGVMYTVVLSYFCHWSAWPCFQRWFQHGLDMLKATQSRSKLQSKDPICVGTSDWSPWGYGTSDDICMGKNVLDQRNAVLLRRAGVERRRAGVEGIQVDTDWISYLVVVKTMSWTIPQSPVL